MAAVNNAITHLKTHPWEAETLGLLTRRADGFVSSTDSQNLTRFGLITNCTDRTVTPLGAEVLKEWQPHRELVNSRAKGGYGIPANYAFVPDGIPAELTSVPAGTKVAEALAAGGLLLADLPQGYAPTLLEDDLTVPDPAAAGSTGYVVIPHHMDGDHPHRHLAEVRYLHEGCATGPDGKPWYAHLWAATRALSAEGAEIRYLNPQVVTARVSVKLNPEF